MPAVRSTETIFTELAVAMPQGASSGTVQALVARWHNTQQFESAEPEHLPRIAARYRDDPHLRADFNKIDPDLAPFVVEAVCIYAAALHSAKLETI